MKTQENVNYIEKSKAENTQNFELKLLRYVDLTTKKTRILILSLVVDNTNFNWSLLLP